MSRKIERIIVVLLGGCLLLAFGCQGERRSDDALREAVKSGNCPGYVAYSLELGREEWSCMGWADAESNRQMEIDSVFRICSMTKSFVGALAAVLADRGEIDLDTPISQTFPEYTGEKSDITLRQCLSMTAGFAEMSPTMLDKGIGSQNPTEVALEMAGLPLETPPGTHFKYSNASFEVAAAVLERRTGRRLDVLLDEVFFLPLGMSDTTFCPTPEIQARMAQIYRIEDGKGWIREKDPMIVRRPDGTCEWHVCASGSLFSSPLDIMKFYQMLLRDGQSEDGRTVMSEGAMRLITTKQTPPCVQVWYSFGFFKRDDRWLGHGGAYGTIAECDLEECRMRMIFTQMYGSNVGRLLRKWRRSTTEEFDEVAWMGSRFFVGEE